MPTSSPLIDLATFELLVSSRRTNLRMDVERPVPVELIDRLCRLATWAPNHKKTWPQRFAVLTGGARERLGREIADALDALGSDQPERVARYRTKYLRAPMMLVVGAAGGDSPLRTAENRDTAAAGCQTLLLGATVAGLATFWSSPPKGAESVINRLCGWDPSTQPVALVYVGWPIGDVAVPERPDPSVVHLDR